MLSTTATPGRSAALDVCVTSPSAAMALGDRADAAATALQGCDPTAGGGWHLVSPSGLDSSGAPPPSCVSDAAVWYAARLASTRGGGEAEAQGFLLCWRHEIQVAIQQRRAAMARVVFPQASAREEWLLSGRTEGAPCPDGRQIQISSDDWDVEENEGELPAADP